MRSWRFAFSLFIAFGLSCFVTALVPTDAYAAWVNMSDNVESYMFGIAQNNPPHASDFVATSGTWSKNMSRFETVSLDTDSSGTTLDYGSAGNYSFTFNGTTGTVYRNGDNYDGTISIDSTTNGRIESNFLSEKFSGLSGLTGTPYMYLSMRMANNAFKAGDKIFISIPAYYVTYVGSSTRTLAMRSPSVWSGNYSGSNVQQATYDANTGLYTLNQTGACLYICFQVTVPESLINGPEFKLGYTSRISVLMAVPDSDILDLKQQTVTNTEDTNQTIEETTAQQTSDINQQIADETQAQTEALNDTTGSDSVTDDVIDDATEQFSTKLGFISQVIDMTGQLFDALTYEGRGTVRFPGIQWDGRWFIRPANVPILGYLGEDIENRVRDGVTLVLFIAWLHGIHSLYARIFLGQVEVMTEDE